MAHRPAQSLIIAALVVLLAFSLPLIVSALWLKVLTSVVIFTLTTASIALLYRRLGLVTLAQVALMGAGGWIGLWLAHHLDFPFEVNLLAGGLGSAMIGMILAYPALRMRGLYLALVTLMAAGGFAIVINVVQFPSGAGGQAGAYMPRPLLAISDSGYFTYAVLVVALGFALLRWHEQSRPGRAWAMIRRSEAVAMAAGVDVTVQKIWCFGLSGFLAGVAGVLLAGNLQLLDARSFPAAESVMIFALTIVGGAWHWPGAVIAALLYRFVPALLNDLGVNGDAAYILFGAALIHTLTTAPQGIAGQLAGLMRRWSNRREPAHDQH